MLTLPRNNIVSGVALSGAELPRTVNPTLLEGMFRQQAGTGEILERASALAESIEGKLVTL